jgi:recombination protein RecA
MSNKLDAFFQSFSDNEKQLDFRMAHETVGEKVPTISTGSYVLDNALSSGGLPKGRIIQYYGAPSSGKSLMSMIAMVHAQKEDPDARQLFIDAEGTFDPNWAESLGVDTTRVLIVHGDTAINGRKCFEMLLGVPKEDAKHVLKGKSKEGFLDKVVNKEFNFNLIVLDSLGSIIPPGEDVSSVGKANISLLSRFLTTTFRKLSLEVSKAQIPFIVINHKKANMDLYGSDHTFSGGNTYAHFLSANIYFEAVGRKDATIFDENEQKIGHTIRATIEKSKFGPCPRKCEFKVEFSKGIIDQHEEIADLAISYDIVNKPSSMSYEYGDRKWVGLSKFHDALKEDEELAQELIQKVTEARDSKIDAKRLEQIALKEAAMANEGKSKKKKSLSVEDEE